MEESKAKTRESNIELYRIVLILLIIAHHYVVNSGLLDVMYENPLSLKSIIMFIIGAWGKIGINCFILITGYFTCQSGITLKKFLKLLLEVEFYKIVIYIIFLCTGIETFNIKSLVKTLFPIYLIAQNFIGCFLVFYLFIPFINVLIKNLNEKQHLLLIALLVFTYSILGNIPKITVVMNYITLFFMIYLIGSYIRIYPKDIFSNKKIINILLCAVVLLCIFSIVFCLIIGNKINKQIAYYFVIDSNKLLAVITSVVMFLWFKNLRIKNSNLINRAASSTFGVLLIHANSDTMRNFLWNTVFKNVAVFRSTVYIYIYIYIYIYAAT